MTLIDIAFHQQPEVAQHHKPAIGYADNALTGGIPTLNLDKVKTALGQELAQIKVREDRLTGVSTHQIDITGRPFAYIRLIERVAIKLRVRDVAAGLRSKMRHLRIEYTADLDPERGNPARHEGELVVAAYG